MTSESVTVTGPRFSMISTGTFGIRKETRSEASSTLAFILSRVGEAFRIICLNSSSVVAIAKPVLTRYIESAIYRLQPVSIWIAVRAPWGDNFLQEWSLLRRMKSCSSTFAVGASFFGTLTAGCGTAFTEWTAFCGSPFLATVAQVLLTGSAGTASMVRLLVSGALGGGFAGRGGRTGGVVAMYCAMAARK